MSSGSGDELVDVLVVLALDYDLRLTSILPDLSHHGFYSGVAIQLLLTRTYTHRKREADKKCIP